MYCRAIRHVCHNAILWELSIWYMWGQTISWTAAYPVMVVLMYPDDTEDQTAPICYTIRYGMTKHGIWCIVQVMWLSCSTFRNFILHFWTYISCQCQWCHTPYRYWVRFLSMAQRGPNGRRRYICSVSKLIHFAMPETCWNWIGPNVKLSSAWSRRKNCYSLICL